MPPPEGHRVENLLRGVEVFHPGHGVVGPIHHHLAAAGLVGLLRAQAGEGGALHRGGNHHPLAGIGVQPDPHQEAGVFAELVFHVMGPSFPFLWTFYGNIMCDYRAF